MPWKSNESEGRSVVSGLLAEMRARHTPHGTVARHQQEEEKGDHCNSCEAHGYPVYLYSLVRVLGRIGLPKSRPSRVDRRCEGVFR